MRHTEQRGREYWSSRTAPELFLLPLQPQMPQSDVFMTQRPQVYQIWHL